MDKYRAYFKDLRKRQRKWLSQKSKAKIVQIKYVPYTYYQKAARDPSSYVVDSGYYSNQTWGALKKAWKGFYASKRLGITFDMIKYAKVIQRLEKELGVEIKDFPTLGLYYFGQALDDEESESDSDDTIKEKCNAIDNLTDSDNKDDENEDFNYDRGNYIV